MTAPVTGYGLLEGLETVQIDALLLECLDKTLRDAVALGFSHVGGCGANAGPLDLGLELSGPVLRTQSCRTPDGLPKLLPRETGGTIRG